MWHSTGTDTGASKRDWIQAARGSRDNAFTEFILAVAEAQAARALKRSPTGAAAQALTALVDGYLFQSLEENVDPSRTLDERLDYVASLVNIILTGLAGQKSLISKRSGE